VDLDFCAFLDGMAYRTGALIGFRRFRSQYPGGLSELTRRFIHVMTLVEPNRHGRMGCEILWTNLWEGCYGTHLGTLGRTHVQEAFQVTQKACPPRIIG
jgi:hypothetical protein